MTVLERRLKLQQLLEDTLGSRNVYFQPPENFKMKYPAIRYQRGSIDNVFADDAIYNQKLSFELTVIDYDPDSAIVERVSKLPNCKFGTHYTADGLNHDTFTINY